MLGMPSDLLVEVTLEQLRGWAELSDDRSPLHTDPAYAARTRFAEPIAHGHLVVSWLMRWAYEWAGTEWLRRGVIDGLQFRSPVLTNRQYAVSGQLNVDRTVSAQILDPYGTIAVTAMFRLADR